MNIDLSKQSESIEGTTVTVFIDAVAVSDDGTQKILERRLSHGMNTLEEGWYDIIVAELKLQKATFKVDAQKVLDIKNQVLNVATDVAKP